MHFPFFNKKYSLLDTQVFQGATDWHCHILPGVDDGIPTMAKALEVLAYYEQLGIQEVWLTPHVLEDIPNTTQMLRQRFHELESAYTGSIRLHLAAEYMMDNLFLSRLEANDLLPIGPDANHLLVELSYLQPAVNLMGTLELIRRSGYQPILAHPERYTYMEKEDYLSIRDCGTLLQLNLLSLTGEYGKTAKHKAEFLLSEGAYSLWGTDLHSLRSFQHAISLPQSNLRNVTFV